MHSNTTKTFEQPDLMKTPSRELIIDCLKAQRREYLHLAARYMRMANEIDEQLKRIEV